MASKVKHTIDGEHVIDGMVLPGHTTQQTIDKCREFHFRPDDLLVESYPKCGSTWMQQICWLVGNDGDVAASNASPIMMRSRYMECIWIDGAHCVDLLKEDPSPRIIKTHLPAHYLKHHLQEGKQAKTVVCLRNVKDMLVSLYHFYRMHAALGNFKGTFDDFFQMFKEKKLIYGDYFEHVLGWWELRDNPNVLFVRYEDMKRDLRKEVKRVAQFAGKKFDDNVINDIVEACTFKSMKANPMTNCEDVPVFDNSISTFLRKGEVGDWKNYFSKENNDYIDKLIREKLHPAGLKMTYDL